MFEPQCPDLAASCVPGVLVVDDDVKLCRLIRDYLQPLGYEVTAAHTGPDGLEVALCEPFAALILDVMLPGMDGFDVLRHLRAKSNVPVLMLTGVGEEASRGVGASSWRMITYQNILDSRVACTSPRCHSPLHDCIHRERRAATLSNQNRQPPYRSRVSGRIAQQYNSAASQRLNSTCCFLSLKLPGE